MRQLVVATAVFVLALSSHAQSSTTAAATTTAPATAQATTTAPANNTPPVLTRTVAVNAGDSELVRAAKRAVASRNAGQRRVVTVIASGGGKVSQGSGTMAPISYPSSGPAPTEPKKSWDQEAAEKRAALEQQKAQELKQEQEHMGSEMDEPYGGDVEEDDAERRMSEANGITQAPAPTPPPSE